MNEKTFAFVGDRVRIIQDGDHLTTGAVTGVGFDVGNTGHRSPAITVHDEATDEVRRVVTGHGTRVEVLTTDGADGVSATIEALGGVGLSNPTDREALRSALVERSREALSRSDIKEWAVTAVHLAELGRDDAERREQDERDGKVEPRYRRGVTHWKRERDRQVGKAQQANAVLLALGDIERAEERAEQRTDDGIALPPPETV